MTTVSEERPGLAAHTPHMPGEAKLSTLASRYVDVDSLPWQSTPCAGIQMKILLKDETTGLMTALFKWEPGARLPMHEHVEIEQSWILEGSLVDDEGECTAGNFVWRPKGNRHYAVAPNGALILAMFLRPNVFIDEFPGQKLA